MSERMGAETTMTVGWIAERMAMGTRGYLNHRLYRRIKLGGDCTISRTAPFFPFFPLLPSAVVGRIGRLLGPLPIAGAAGAPLMDSFGFVGPLEVIGVGRLV